MALALSFAAGRFAGIHTRGASRPRSQSKISRRAKRLCCEDHPVSKSRDKGKGARKIRSRDVLLNHQLVSWRVVDSRGEGWWPGAGVVGASATGMVNYLEDYRCDDRRCVGEVAYVEDEVSEGILWDPFAISFDLYVGCKDVEWREQHQEIDEKEVEGVGFDEAKEDDMGVGCVDVEQAKHLEIQEVADDKHLREIERREDGMMRSLGVLFSDAFVADQSVTKHSKYTGKWHPVAKSRETAKRAQRKLRSVKQWHQDAKSRDKAKGARKLRWQDVSLNHRLVSLHVGVPASGILGILEDYGYEDEDCGEVNYEEDEDGGGVHGDPSAITHDLDVSCSDQEGGGVQGDSSSISSLLDLGCGHEEGSGLRDVGDGLPEDPFAVGCGDGEQGKHEETHEEEAAEEMEGGWYEAEEDEDDDMGFCEVGFECVDEDGWSMVVEI